MSQHVIGSSMAAVAVPRQRTHSVRAEIADLVGNIVSIGGQHATLAGGEILVAEEGKASDVAQRAGGS